MSGRSTTQARVPEFFCTSVRKIEPVGGDCIRIYCSIEGNGVWEDRFTILVPIASAIASAKFVIDAATEIFDESQAIENKALAH